MGLNILLAILVLATICLIFARKLLQKVTIFEYERGLKYDRGRYRELLEPGQYWIFKPTTAVTRVDVRPRVISVPGQEVLSSDSVSLKVSLVAQYEIVDPYLAINKTSNYLEALYAVLQVAAREIIGSEKIDEILEQRHSLGEKLLAMTAPRSQELGLKLTFVNVKDIMFPGDLKKVFAQVVKARKEGLAALEKARGESASLRNLANAARLLENNPALMQLRVLQSVGESSGHTLVLGMPPATTPFPLHRKGDPTKGQPEIEQEPQDTE